jgi:hypothetical protein
MCDKGERRVLQAATTTRSTGKEFCVKARRFFCRQGGGNSRSPNTPVQSTQDDLDAGCRHTSLRVMAARQASSPLKDCQPVHHPLFSLYKRDHWRNVQTHIIR